MIVVGYQGAIANEIEEQLQNLTEAALNETNEAIIVFGTLQQHSLYIQQLRSRGVRVLACPGPRDLFISDSPVSPSSPHILSTTTFPSPSSSSSSSSPSSSS